MYAKETKDNIISMSFYSHFGSHHFLNALYNEMKETGSSSELSFSKDSFKVTEGEYGDDDWFPVNITFNNYNYYKNGTPQSVSGKAYLVFYGSIEDTSFTAKNFTIYSDKLTLSDDEGEHKEASITFGSEAEPLIGFFGTETGGSIAFIAKEDADSNGKTIARITKYTTEDTGEQDETAYDAEKHAFCLNEEDFPALEF